MEPTRHRHFIGLPLLILAVLTSLLHVGPEVSSLRAGVGEVREVEGTELVAGEGFFTVRSGPWKFSGLSGGFSVVQQESETIVSAVSTPVLIEYGEEKTIVPQGMSWLGDNAQGLSSLEEGVQLWLQSRSVRFLPDHFYKRSVEGLREIPVESVLPDVHEVGDGAPSFESLLLPGARSALNAQYTESILSDLASAVRSGSEEEVEKRIAEVSIADVYVSERGIEVLSALLSNATDTQQMHLFQPLALSESIILLASLHPSSASAAWLTRVDALSEEAQLLRLVLLPFADFATSPLSDFTLKRFEDAVQDRIGNSNNAAELRNTFFALHAPLVQILSSRGYPQRSERLRSYLTSLVGDHRGELNDSNASLYNTLLREYAPVLDPLSPAIEASSTEDGVTETHEEEKSDTPVFGPAEVESRAYAILSDAGALFTVQTGIAAVSGTQARISDVLFAGSQGDRSVTFTLDVVSGLVRDIDLNGNTNFRYETPFDAFVAWMRK